jgi:hypothetical protein
MLDKATLITQLTTIFSNLDPNKTPAQVAQDMANAIETFVKSGTVTSNGQTSPTVPGSPATITNLPGTIS